MLTQMLNGDRKQGAILDTEPASNQFSGTSTPATIDTNTTADVEKEAPKLPPAFDQDASSATNMIEQEAVVAPTSKEILHVILSPSTLAVAVPYACSFGSELAINSIPSAYYSTTFPEMGQSLSGQLATMFGLLNVVCRPAGGFFADKLYRFTNNSVWSKKLLLCFLGVAMAAFELVIGLSKPTEKAALFGLVAGLAFFLEAANGANFALVPHIHPFANGVVSVVVGRFGNLGGIIFSVIFRYNGSRYGQSLWIIGVISLAANLAVGLIRPVPRPSGS